MIIIKCKKSDIEGKTQTRIFPLNQEEKLTEIAQLLSGSKITDAANSSGKRTHAINFVTKI